MTTEDWDNPARGAGDVGDDADSLPDASDAPPPPFEEDDEDSPEEGPIQSVR